MRIGRDAGRFGSSFKLLREDLARKASIVRAILWNFYLLAPSLFLLLLSCILYYNYAKRTRRFLEQPPDPLDRNTVRV
jgi:hypothetical protein